LSKHRRPSRLAQLGKMANTPVHLGIAAGVAGTLSVTGSVVANASPASKPKQNLRAKPVAHQFAPVNPSDIGQTQAALAQRDAVVEAQRERAERIARAKARAEARRKAAREARREARQEARAAERAEAARTFTSASRSVERMSASAQNVLNIAAQVASDAYYAYGGSGPNGFDCSGFTSYVFGKVGINLPHSSSAQAGVATRVSNPQPGDLVFVYNGGGGSIGHVAIYAGNGYWWEASNPSGGVGKHRAWSSNVSYGRVL
jgi:cell wall-associated NlpC family hydrolase